MYNKPRKIKVPTDSSEAFGKALKTAFNILSYKDNTSKELKGKLTDRGYLPETVEDVCSYMAEKGFINDERMMYRLVRTLACTKLYGKRRIKQFLCQKDFDKETLNSLDFENEEISDIDFADVCYRLLKKRGGERDEKTYAFLVRHGHSPSDIRAAYKRMADEE